jgi:hypothetical protein
MHYLDFVSATTGRTQDLLTVAAIAVFVHEARSLVCRLIPADHRDRGGAPVDPDERSPDASPSAAAVRELHLEAHRRYLAWAAGRSAAAAGSGRMRV